MSFSLSPCSYSYTASDSMLPLSLPLRVSRRFSLLHRQALVREKGRSQFFNFATQCDIGWKQNKRRRNIHSRAPGSASNAWNMPTFQRREPGFARVSFCFSFVCLVRYDSTPSWRIRGGVFANLARPNYALNSKRAESRDGEKREKEISQAKR